MSLTPSIGPFVDWDPFSREDRQDAVCTNDNFVATWHPPHHEPRTMMPTAVTYEAVVPTASCSPSREATSTIGIISPRETSQPLANQSSESLSHRKEAWTAGVIIFILLVVYSLGRRMGLWSRLSGWCNSSTQPVRAAQHTLPAANPTPVNTAQTDAQVPDDIEFDTLTGSFSDGSQIPSTDFDLLADGDDQDRAGNNAATQARNDQIEDHTSSIEDPDAMAPNTNSEEHEQ